jgi:predicted dienelactone hydrolase
MATLNGEKKSMQASNRFCRLLSVISVCLTATLAQAAGLRSFDIPADADGPAIHGMIWYPCAEAPGRIPVGVFVLPGVKDCPLAGNHLPLVAASHGRGGWFLGNHDTAETLADNGFVVAAINHPGDTAQDLSRSGELSVFVERPTDIKRLIDFMIAASPFACHRSLSVT